MAKTREGNEKAEKAEKSEKNEKNEKKVSQRAMVQSALETCGWDAKPQEMQTHIKEKFGVELAPNIISNYKSQIKRATRTPAAAGSRGRRDRPLMFEDLETVRSLIDRLGAEQVKKIIDVVG